MYLLEPTGFGLNKPKSDIKGLSTSTTVNGRIDAPVLARSASFDARSRSMSIDERDKIIQK